MEIKNVDDFYALVLAIIMIGIECMALIVGAPIMGGMPVLTIEIRNGYGIIHLIPFITAVTAVLFLFVMNLWFTKGFMNVIRSIRRERALRKTFIEDDDGE